MESCYITQGAQSGLCDNLEEWDAGRGGGRFNREGTYVYLRLIHVVIWQKPAQHCKAIILQLKINYIYIYVCMYVFLASKGSQPACCEDSSNPDGRPT